jgi:tetratricopeptide (TPR) repeat protein
MKKIAIIFSSLLICLQLIAQKIESEPNFQHGVTFFNLGEYRVALDHFNNAINAKPNNAMAYYYLGYINLYLGKKQESGEYFNKAYKIEPNDAVIAAALANFYTESYDFKKAEKLLEKAIRINPFYPESYNNKGVLLFKRGQYRAALENYNIAIKLDSTFALAYSNRGTVRYYNQDVSSASKTDLRLAINDFNKALQLEPNLEIALKNRGIAYKLMGELDSSMIDYNIFIQQNPKNESGYLERGKLKIQQKDYKSAIEDFMIALELKPDFAEAYYQRANAKSKLKYYEAANEDLIKAMAYNQNIIPRALYKIAANYAMLNDSTKAQKFLNECFAKNYFSSKDNLQQFFKDEDFNNLKNNKEFIAFKEKLKKLYKK